MDDLRNILSKDTQRSIDGLVRADLERFVNKFGYTLVKLTEVEKPVSKVEKAKRKKVTPRKRVEIPEVFGRKFDSVSKLANVFKVRTGSIYYWLDNGHDLEEKLREHGVMPDKEEGVVITRKENGEKIWK